MRRRVNPAKSKVEAKPPVARKSPKNDGAKVHDLEKRLAEALKRETEAQEQQAATAEILRTIGASPSDVQPVFDAIARSCVRLGQGVFGGVFRFDGELIHLEAHHNFPPAALERYRQTFPRPPGAENVITRTILERRIVHVPDINADASLSLSQSLSRTVGYRSALSVPMLRDGRAVGAVAVARVEPGGFSEKQIALLQTFADQAVIAIENVRLFKELEEKNRALTTAHAQVTEALEQQTATSEILRVISSSQRDVQPVFETIVRNAVDLCGASQGGAYRFDGEFIHSIAHAGYTPEQLAHWRSTFPRRLPDAGPLGRAILTRTVDLIRDIESDPGRLGGPETVANIRVRGSRSVLTVPMVRDDKVIGAIALAHREVDGFSDVKVELLRTFADQAVIAIENVRLFNELEARTAALTRSVGQLTALGEVSRALSSTLDLETVLNTIVARASELAGTNACTVYEYNDATGEFHWRASANPDEEVEAVARRTPIPRGVGAQGRMAVTRAPVQIPDIAAEDAYHGPLRDVLLQTGTRAILAVPLLRDDQLVGGLTVNRKTPGEFTPEVVDLLKTFATQSALAIQNARLFRELADKSRQLEAASQHKSEFLANMSHELRTPLNAIIGFSEVLTERMFGDLNEKQDEYLKDIYASGTHLLSLINDILDLSKIEAGRMELELTDFDLPQAIDNALTLVRERAGRRGIALHQSVEAHLGEIKGDERKVKQVLLNLLSNALKFTPEGGRVEVLARVVDGMAEISVTDTGVGIAAEDQEAVFEEFRQVGTAEKKAEGTGLGLTLCRKFIELHGGRIWVKSQVGAGSSFTFSIPVRRDE